MYDVMKQTAPTSVASTNGAGPTISVINYNNPTINMNFNEKPQKPQSNFLTSPKNAEDNADFYESLNYSKFANNI